MFYCNKLQKLKPLKKYITIVITILYSKTIAYLTTAIIIIIHSNVVINIKITILIFMA